MSQRTAEERLGDLFLDRYMPEATPEEQEVARRNVLEFVDALIAIASRRARESLNARIRENDDDSIDSGSGRLPPP